MLTLHTAPGSCSRASHIALEEAGLDYQARFVDFAKADQRQPDFLAINPKGRVPALVTDRGVLTEGPAILAYVAGLAPQARLAPTDPFDFARMQAFNLYLASTIHVAHAHGRRAARWSDDPAAQAELFANAGAEWLHVVDLDGAFAGESVNGGAVAAILERFGGHVQLGGGIRNRDSIERWLDLGVRRVVIGTAALENPDLVREAARDNPGRIVVAVDARDGMVATHGWADVSDVAVVDLARRFEDAGVAALLFTDVGRDELLKGCNVEATVALARAVAIPVIASGGVTDIADIHALRPHVEDGVEGVITGRALYDGRLDLKWAIEVGKA